MVEIAKYLDCLSFLDKMFHVKRPLYANKVGDYPAVDTERIEGEHDE